MMLSFYNDGLIILYSDWLINNPWALSLPGLKETPAHRVIWLTEFTEWVTDWLNGWLTDWLIDWMVDWIFDWLTEWLIGWLNEWMT